MDTKFLFLKKPEKHTLIKISSTNGAYLAGGLHKEEGK